MIYAKFRINKQVFYVEEPTLWAVAACLLNFRSILSIERSLFLANISCPAQLCFSFNNAPVKSVKDI